jgi:hypothetical protein
MPNVPQEARQRELPPKMVTGSTDSFGSLILWLVRSVQRLFYGLFALVNEIPERRMMGFEYDPQSRAIEFARCEDIVRLSKARRTLLARREALVNA